VTPTWEQSVKKAREGNWRAIEGRFAAAMASFEQIPPETMGPTKPGARSVLDFATDVGMEYSTIAFYRSVVYWWYESDLELADEIGVPRDFTWGALRWGKASLLLAAVIRQDTANATPANGKTWTAEDLAILYRHEPRRRAIDDGPFDNTMKTVRSARDRLTRALTTVDRLSLSAGQRRRLLAEAEQLRAPLDFLTSYLEGDATVMEQIDAFLARERASA
jgi:hypothetical protein